MAILGGLSAYPRGPPRILLGLAALLLPLLAAGGIGLASATVARGSLSEEEAAETKLIAEASRDNYAAAYAAAVYAAAACAVAAAAAAPVLILEAAGQAWPGGAPVKSVFRQQRDFEQEGAAGGFKAPLTEDIEAEPRRGLVGLASVDAIARPSLFALPLEGEALATFLEASSHGPYRNKAANAGSSPPSWTDTKRLAFGGRPSCPASNPLADESRKRASAAAGSALLQSQLLQQQRWLLLQSGRTEKERRRQQQQKQQQQQQQHHQQQQQQRQHQQQQHQHQQQQEKQQEKQQEQVHEQHKSSVLKRGPSREIAQEGGAHAGGLVSGPSDQQVVGPLTGSVLSRGPPQTSREAPRSCPVKPSLPAPLRGPLAAVETCRREEDGVVGAPRGGGPRIDCGGRRQQRGRRSQERDARKGCEEPPFDDELMRLVMGGLEASVEETDPSLFSPLRLPKHVSGFKGQGPPPSATFALSSSSASSSAFPAGSRGAAVGEGEWPQMAWVLGAALDVESGRGALTPPAAEGYSLLEALEYTLQLHAEELASEGAALGLFRGGAPAGAPQMVTLQYSFDSVPLHEQRVIRAELEKEEDQGLFHESKRRSSSSLMLTPAQVQLSGGRGSELLSLIEEGKPVQANGYHELWVRYLEGPEGVATLRLSSLSLEDLRIILALQDETGGPLSLAVAEDWGEGNEADFSLSGGPPPKLNGAAASRPRQEGGPLDGEGGDEGLEEIDIYEDDADETADDSFWIWELFDEEW
ncbi:hypothetical protein Emag_002891 [Eimeria magna]